MKEYFVLIDKDERPLANAGRWYNELLHAFGLGPFTHDEGIGALKHCSQSGQGAEKILKDLETSGLMMRG